MLCGAASHKQCEKSENALVYAYYNWNGLMDICILGAEGFACGLYLGHHNPELFEVLKPLAAVAGVIFNFKQLVSLVQLWLSLYRLVEKDCIDKMGQIRN